MRLCREGSRSRDVSPTPRSLRAEPVRDDSGGRLPEPDKLTRRVYQDDEGAAAVRRLRLLLRLLPRVDPPGDADHPGRGGLVVPGPAEGRRLLRLAADRCYQRV